MSNRRYLFWGSLGLLLAGQFSQAVGVTSAQEAVTPSPTTEVCANPTGLGWPFPFGPQEIPWGLAEAEFQETFGMLEDCAGYGPAPRGFMINGVDTGDGIVDVEVSFTGSDRRLTAIDVWGPGAYTWADGLEQLVGAPFQVQRQHEIETISDCTFNQCWSVSRPITRETDPALNAENLRVTFLDLQQVHRWATSFERGTYRAKLELRSPL